MAEGLRIVTFNVFPPAYQLVADWAARHEHRLVLLVTLPSRHGERYGAEHPNLIELVPEGQDILITNRLRRTAAPAIAALEPDLIVSATFPRRIPAEVTTIPRFGAVNLHPAPLPRGRGPNPMRLIYEGDLTVGAALHRTAHEFDAGAILSCREQRLPERVTTEIIYETWMEMLRTVLEEGTRRAIAGEPGEPQDERLATYAGPFTEEERWLTWHEPALTVQRRAAALNVLGSVTRARLNGHVVTVLDVRACPELAPSAEPGTILDQIGDVVTIRVADGAVEATIRPSSHRTEPRAVQSMNGAWPAAANDDSLRLDATSRGKTMDQSIIDGNAASLERLRTLIARLSDDDLRRDIGDGWTVAAALAHVAFWDRRALVLLERWERDGVSPSPADVHALNDALLPQWRAIPPRAAAEDALAIAEAVDRKVATLSEDLARQVREGGDILLDRSDHRTEHVDELEQLLAP